jgi:hypothetical protein
MSEYISIEDIIKKYAIEEYTKDFKNKTVITNDDNLKLFDDGVYIVKKQDKANSLEIIRITTKISKGWVYNGKEKLIDRLYLFSYTVFDSYVPMEPEKVIIPKHKIEQHGNHVLLIEELKTVINRKINSTGFTHQPQKNLSQSPPNLCIDNTPLLGCMDIAVDENAAKNLVKNNKQLKSRHEPLCLHDRLMQEIRLKQQ